MQQTEPLLVRKVSMVFKFSPGESIDNTSFQASRSSDGALLDDGELNSIHRCLWVYTTCNTKVVSPNDSNGKIFPGVQSMMISRDESRSNQSEVNAPLLRCYLGCARSHVISLCVGRYPPTERDEQRKEKRGAALSSCTLTWWRERKMRLGVRQ